jgi:hypothetical protein
VSKWIIPKAFEDRIIEEAAKPNPYRLMFEHQPTPVPLSRRVRLRLRWYRSRWPLVIEALKNEHECE